MGRFALMIIVGMAVMPALSQAPAQKPAFEVVSIKPNKSGRLESDYQPVVGGRLTVNNVTLKAIIIAAYHVGDSQISGGPQWMDSDRFDINAKAERDVPLNEALQMLQTTLTDRFKLVYHRETKDVAGYTLLAGNAPNLKQARGEGESGIKTTPIEGQKSVVQVAGKNITIQHFVDVLGNQLRAPVVERTGLKGSFDFSFNLDMGDPPAGTTPDMTPAIFTALQEQLGLKLESTKVPVELFVIDSAERPSEN